MKFQLSLIFVLLAPSILFMIIGCESTSQNQGESSTTGVDSVTLKSDINRSNPLTGITDDPNRFPYIGVLEDSTLEFKAYTVHFKLRHQKPLVPITSDKLYWIDENNSNEKLGIFLTYVPSGREINLGTSQIRVDYFNKSIPGCATTDELFSWWTETNMSDPRSRVLKEKQTIKTKGGQSAQVMELLAVRQDTVALTPKYLAVGYLDYHDEYMIGMNLTAVDSFEFKDLLPSFYALVESFE